ncbi:MAG TPA: YgiQ family radical SAM protein [Gammaproteobacteria bacterium]|nr:YgiQ family radical SAM protein [Gammaproteobacteria bacterium]
MPTPTSLIAYKPYWAKRFGIAPFLPMSRAEMEDLGWDSCDVILVTGDAYVDHPSFGMALVGRLLEVQGFRVGIIAQPDWHSADAFAALGRPNLYFGVTAGNMDSMVNRYTADRKIRSEDAYTPGGASGRRPDRAVLVYSTRCREAFPEVPLVIGGIEASLRRIAHYDYWSDKVRRSFLVDAKADLLMFGNAERALVELTHRLARGTPIAEITDLRGTAVMRKDAPGDWRILEPSGAGSDRESADVQPGRTAVRLPAYEEVSQDPVAYARASRILHQETNPGNARPLMQRHGDRELWLNPPPIPLSTAEMDYVYDLPYARAPHPAYRGERIPAWEMIRHSVNIMRGCFGGCTFCSITEHEGRIIQSRSKGSVLREIEAIRDKVEGFTGVISDLGGPTANMYRIACKSREIEASCRRPSCVYPTICTNLNTDHSALIELYREARALPGVKKVLIGSGVRYDLAVRSPAYVKELVQHHVGGYLKIAPEHSEENVLKKMMKPGMTSYERFRELFEKYSKEAGKEQYLIPYFIAAHPGTTDEDMLNLALWLKRHNLRLDQVQTFTPTPMATATAMYHTRLDPLHRISGAEQGMPVPKSGTQRRLHKAFLRYHDPENWLLLRKALRRMGRADLIGNGKRHLVPAWQPTTEKARMIDPGKVRRIASNKGRRLNK